MAQQSVVHIYPSPDEIKENAPIIRFDEKR